MVSTIMVLDLKSLSNTSLHVKEDFRKGKDGFCLGLNRRHHSSVVDDPIPCFANAKKLKDKVG
jgi:hypothetical protein